MTYKKFDTSWNESVNDTTIIQAFPHYLIIDRNGKILDNNAPRPSDKLLETRLNQALNI